MHGPQKLLGAVIIVTIIVLICYHYTGTTAVQSSVDGNYYHVLKDFPNHKEAADLMAEVNTNIIDFMRYLKVKYHIDETADQIKHEGPLHPSSSDVYKIMQYLLDNYNYEVLYENDPRNISGDTSYTVNKGDKMFLCLRNKGNPDQLVDYNTLMFVLLHEVGHIANYNGWGHDTRFWTVFKLILHEAVAFGVYQPIDYSIAPVMYCGLNVNYSPLYDTDLPNLWQS